MSDPDLPEKLRKLADTLSQTFFLADSEEPATLRDAADELLAWRCADGQAQGGPDVTDSERLETIAEVLDQFPSLEVGGEKATATLRRIAAARKKISASGFAGNAATKKWERTE